MAKAKRNKTLTEGLETSFEDPLQEVLSKLSPQDQARVLALNSYQAKLNYATTLSKLGKIGKTPKKNTYFSGGGTQNPKTLLITRLSRKKGKIC